MEHGQATILTRAVKDKLLWILDLDGVIYRGNEAVEGAADVIAALRTRGKSIAFLTNNSTRSKEMYVELLSKFGIKATADEIYTSASITVSILEKWATEHGMQDRKKVSIYLIGERGIREGLENAGFTVLDDASFKADTSLYTKVHHVVVGLDRALTYQKLSIALKCLLGGALFVATNDDANIPLEGGLSGPGAGSIVQALVTCSGKTPALGSPFGKPNPVVLERVLQHANVEASAAIVVGDRLETDILVARKLDVSSMLVLTGVTTDADHFPPGLEPDFVLPSIGHLKAFLDARKGNQRAGEQDPSAWYTGTPTR